MKAVLVLALFAVAAFAAEVSDTQAYLGYDKEFEADKTGGEFYVKFTVPASYLPAMTNGTYGATTPQLYIRAQFPDNSKAAVVKFWVMKGSRPTVTGTPLKTKSTTDTQVYITVDISTDMTGGDYYIGGIVESCNTCLKTANIKIAPALQWLTAGTAVMQPYPAIDNTYTMDYTIKATKYGVPAVLTLDADTDVYVKVSTQTSSKGAAVMMTFVMTSWASAPADPVAASQTDSFKKYPGAAITGDYSTGGIPLKKGTWYIAPYGLSTVISGSDIDFDFAIGIGHQPAAAGTVMPSFFVMVALLVSSIVAYVAL